MAYKDFDAGFGFSQGQGSDQGTILQIDGDAVELPDSSYISHADFSRDGMDLVLDGPQGELVVEGYFAADNAPMLTADDGSALSPELVNSFLKASPEYAMNSSMSDVSPVGAVQEMSGEATVTRIDGSSEPMHMGTPIYQGDIVETAADGAVNIVFSDDTSFAVSEDARLAIDEYVFDPGTEAGVQNFSVLKGLFVFTSGMIGREDPDDVHIETPVGSIGIRGTIIAGDVNEGEITVIEGAIVLRDLQGNEVTLSDQFETATFKPGQGIEHNGQKSAEEIAGKFESISKVSPNLFASINDAAAEADATEEAAEDANPEGSVDENGDGEVDGSVDEAGADEQAEGEEAAEDATEEDAAEDAAEDGEGEETAADDGADQDTGSDDGGFGDDNSGFGDDNSGFGDGADGPPPPPGGDNGAPGDPPPPGGDNGSNDDGTGDDTSGEELPPPPPDPDRGVRPDFLGRFAPQHGHDGGPTYFAMDSNAASNFVFDFGQFFSDADGDLTNFGMYVNGNGGDYIDLNAGGIFDPTTGTINLNVLNSFQNGGVSGDTFTITITAYDAEGHAMSHDFTFGAFETSLFISPIISGDGGSYSSDTGAFGASIGAVNAANGNTIFINYDGTGSNQVYVQNGSSNNVIYLRGVDNTVNFEDGSMNNTVFGSEGTDFFNMYDSANVTDNNGQNTIYGMGGNDVVTFSADSIVGLNAGGFIDGGTHGDGVVGTPDGDVLKLVGSIDFRNINDDAIRNMEIIDTVGDTTAQTVTLAYSDILEMTDGNNTLIINLGGNDALDLDGIDLSGFSSTDVDVDNDGFTDYVSYTNGDITLVITDGATVNTV